MDTCLSYIHRFDHCALLGIMNSAPQCTLPITEMVKKTKDADYSIPIPAPPIAAEYIRNPASATGTIIAIDTTRAQPCGAAGIAVIDVTLPDNSHALFGNTAKTSLKWDAKLGSWILTEDTDIYLRAAQCIQQNPSESGTDNDS
ncbi:hypothetical protein PRIPAC_87795 [Pristionchus pacificus]|uniref:Uncharacterized protein n=1 Tax=Pristionchus pacificus TaxID=54126 RepID=A0A2A6B6G1_PRIPA|nr:hypothetical protein PRIPAC_87795 [Pristionchus pacificus]|eukprot:PDM61441.1 hypothetical protein PRIPAC_50883 [Pristionchus pacificus]